MKQSEFTPLFTEQQRASLSADLLALLDNLTTHHKRDKQWAAEQLDCAKHHIANDYHDSIAFGTRCGASPERSHEIAMCFAQAKAEKWQQGKLQYLIWAQVEHENSWQTQSAKRRKAKHIQPA